MDVSKLKISKNNPRQINGDQFERLKQSIREFPEMMRLRPIVYDPATMEVLGGNMRLRAIRELNMKDIPDEWFVSADDLTDEQKREFVIKDNVGFGEWDYDILANEWDDLPLEDWGMINILDGNKYEEEKELYTRKIEAPTYEPKNEKPQTGELFDSSKYNELVKEIEEASINDGLKEFLKIAATRHIVFDYSKIADYYAHSEVEAQELMGHSALVIIDMDMAIE